MKNTGTLYRSTEKAPTVFPEFRDLLPPLSQEQKEALEKDILQNGCYAPVIVDQKLRIVDGHNRHAICKNHEIPYTMLVFEFEDALEAKQWALDTQKGRRNLDNWELGKIALKLKPDVESRAREKQQEYHGNQYESGLSATLPEVQTNPIDTRKELAHAVGLGERTMGKVIQIDENAPEVVKDALDNKELSINQGYNLTRQLRQIPEEQREDAAKDALENLRKEVKRRMQRLTARRRLLNVSVQFTKRSTYWRSARTTSESGWTAPV